MAKDEFDIFHRYYTYPHPEKIFVTELPTVESVKNDCIFVLDTNALLVPFSTGSQSLDEIGKILIELKANGQLKIPDQVAREFADNRPKKLSEMFHAISQKRNGINELKIGLYPLLEKLPEYNEALSLEKELFELMGRYRKSIGKVVDTIKSWSWDDPVSVLYKEIFTPDIIHVLAIDKVKVQEDLNYRYQHKMPPGYKDENKDDNGIGDYLIWLAIKNIGETTKKNVVFVSGDEKPDWFHKSNKQPLYPRFELLSEFSSISDNHSFHIIRLSDLLLIKGANEEVITEVKEEERLERARFSMPGYIVAEKAVYFYYKSNFGNATLQPQGARNFYSFSYVDDDSSDTAVCVILLRSSYTASKILVRDRLRKIDSISFLSEVEDLNIVFVTKDADFDVQKFENDTQNILKELKFSGLNINISYGYLSDSGEYHPIPRQIGLF